MMKNHVMRGLAACAAVAALTSGAVPAAVAVDGAAGVAGDSPATVESDVLDDDMTASRSVTVAGRTVALTSDGQGGWVGGVALTDYAAVPDADTPLTVVVAGDAPATYQLAHDATASSATVAPGDLLGVVRRQGALVFSGRLDGDLGATTVTVSYDGSTGRAASADGHGFTWNADSDRWVSSWRVEWTDGATPALTELAFDDGETETMLPVDWHVSNNGAGELVASATLEGVVSNDAGEAAWSVTVDAVRPAARSRSVTVDGVAHDLTLGDDGVWTLTLPTDTDGDLPSSLTATVREEGVPDRTVTLPVVLSGVTSAWPALGVVAHAGSASYEAEDMRVTLPAAWSVGAPVTATLDGGALAFSLGEDGTWRAAATTTLDLSDTPAVDAIDLDGRRIGIDWDDEARVQTTDTTTIHTRSGVVSGEVTVDGQTQRWSLDVVASRVEGRVASLSVLQRNADGTTDTHAISGFDPETTEYALLLPADAVTASYSLGYSSASDVAGVSEGDPIAPRLGEGASRILQVTLNGVTYAVTVRFEAVQPEPSNTDARLSGIFVNLSGETTRGDLIDGWDPDVLSYTLRVPADAPGVYVVPEAGDGVTVVASDVIQSGWSVTQRWTATAGNGQSRVYQVTVVRDHDQPTADEAFVPPATSDVDGTTPADDRAQTSLVSHGYLDADGVYHAVEAESYRIPEGGGFAFASHAGQSVSVAGEKISPMNWCYTVSVLAPDGLTFARHTYQIVFVTEATTLAELTGLDVNNQPVGGFDPATTDYAVAVGDLDHWTVVPRFDRTTGMSVSTHRDHDTATVTVTSADGLNTRVYTVRARLAQGASTDGVLVDGLADTGAGVMPAVLAAGVMIAVGGVLAGVRRLRRRAAHRG